MDKFEDNLEGITPYDVTEIMGNLGNNFDIEKPENIPDFIWQKISKQRKRAILTVHKNKPASSANKH